MKAMQKSINAKRSFAHANGWRVAANDDVYRNTTLASLSTNDVQATQADFCSCKICIPAIHGSRVNIPADDWNIPYTAPLNSTAGAHAQITIYHNDVLGSPIAFTNEEGVLQARKEFQPYGLSDDVSNDTTNTIGFTGHVEARDFGLVYMQHRWYDAKSTHRFLSMDVPLFDESNPMSFNRYAYANDNPYKYTDPDGNCVQNPLIFIACVVGAIALYDVATESNDEGKSAVKNLSQPNKDRDAAIDCAADPKCKENPQELANKSDEQRQQGVQDAAKLAKTLAEGVPGQSTTGPPGSDLLVITGAQAAIDYLGNKLLGRTDDPTKDNKESNEGN